MVSYDVEYSEASKGEVDVQVIAVLSSIHDNSTFCSFLLSESSKDKSEGLQVHLETVN